MSPQACFSQLEVFSSHLVCYLGSSLSVYLLSSRVEDPGKFESRHL